MKCSLSDNDTSVAGYQKDSHSLGNWGTFFLTLWAPHPFALWPSLFIPFSLSHPIQRVQQNKIETTRITITSHRVLIVLRTYIYTYVKNMHMYVGTCTYYVYDLILSYRQTEYIATSYNCFKFNNYLQFSMFYTFIFPI